MTVVIVASVMLTGLCLHQFTVTLRRPDQAGQSARRRFLFEPLPIRVQEHRHRLISQQWRLPLPTRAPPDARPDLPDRE